MSREIIDCIGCGMRAGAERFMRANPDGYTLATLNDSILTMIPNLYKKVAYDPLRIQ